MIQVGPGDGTELKLYVVKCGNKDALLSQILAGGLADKLRGLTAELCTTWCEFSSRGCGIERLRRLTGLSIELIV